jgi:transcriptional regulator with AAA-type ATPase domain
MITSVLYTRLDRPVEMVSAASTRSVETYTIPAWSSPDDANRLISAPTLHPPEMLRAHSLGSLPMQLPGFAARRTADRADFSLVFFHDNRFAVEENFVKSKLPPQMYLKQAVERR